MNEKSTILAETISQVIQGLQLELPDSVLPDPAILNYYKFEKDRKLFLDQDVDYPTLEMVKSIMLWNAEDKNIPVEDRKPIYVYIMSNGGSLQYMWSMIDAMLASKTPIITVNLGTAASAASLIFLAGSKRYMMPYSMVIIHEGSAEMSGDANKIMDTVDNYKEEIKKMRAFILSRTKIPASTFTRKSKDDWYINADQSLEYEICNHIVKNLDEIM